MLSVADITKSLPANAECVEQFCLAFVRRPNCKCARNSCNDVGWPVAPHRFHVHLGSSGRIQKYQLMSGDVCQEVSFLLFWFSAEASSWESF